MYLHMQIQKTNNYNTDNTSMIKFRTNHHDSQDSLDALVRSPSQDGHSIIHHLSTANKDPIRIRLINRSKNITLLEGNTSSVKLTISSCQSASKHSPRKFTIPQNSFATKNRYDSEPIRPFHCRKQKGKQISQQQLSRLKQMMDKMNKASKFKTLATNHFQSQQFQSQNKLLKCIDDRQNKYKKLEREQVSLKAMKLKPINLKQFKSKRYRNKMEPCDVKLINKNIIKRQVPMFQQKIQSFDHTVKGWITYD